MLKPDNRLAILMHEGILGKFGKTGLGLLRYSQNPIAAVIDRECAGQSLPALTGIRVRYRLWRRCRKRWRTAPIRW